MKTEFSMSTTSPVHRCAKTSREIWQEPLKEYQSYKKPCLLSDVAKEELRWWTDQLTRWNEKA